MSDARNSVHSIVPTNVSNRQLIKQIEMWGFTEHKTQGDLVTYKRGERRLNVMRGHVHQGNSTAMVRAVYGVVCGGDALTFWGRTEQMEPAAVSAQKVNDLRLLPQLLARSIPQPEPEKEEPVMEKKRALPERGLSERLRTLCEANPNKTWTSIAASEALGCTQRQGQNVLYNLCTVGFLRRLRGRGRYKLAVEPVPPVPPPTVSIFNNGEVLPAPIEPLHSRAVLGGILPVSPAATVTIRQPAPPPVNRFNDLDVLLELIVPENYVFQVKHLNAMRQWQAQTAELLSILRGEL